MTKKTFGEKMRIKEAKFHDSLYNLKEKILVVTDKATGGIRGPGMTHQDQRIVRWAQFNEPGIKRYLYPGFGLMAGVIINKLTTQRPSISKLCAVAIALAYAGFVKARLEHRDDCIRKVIVSNSKSTYANALRAKHSNLLEKKH